MKTVGLALTVIVLLGVAYFLYQGQMAPKQNQTSTSQTQAPTGSSMETKSTVLAGTKTPYKEFSKEEYDEALKSGKVVLLNFYANWCPICRAEEPDLLKGFNVLDLENVVAFRVNYNDSDTDDAEKALAKEFGITYQHTKVILKDGKVVKKVIEQWDEQQLAAELQKVVQ